MVGKPNGRAESEICAAYSRYGSPDKIRSAGRNENVKMLDRPAKTMYKIDCKMHKVDS
jgi:hypothetical protein